eukprot:COSAG05_NODE_14917_length_383_cov_0.901408_1_plen_52_part_10
MIQPTIAQQDNGAPITGAPVVVAMVPAIASGIVIRVRLANSPASRRLSQRLL